MEEETGCTDVTGAVHTGDAREHKEGVCANEGTKDARACHSRGVITSG